MANYDYDLFVIGAGSGGVRAARMSASFGARVAVAEDRYYGGTCVNVGCVPKKLFVYASHFREDFEIARSFGWSMSDIRFNWQQLIQNKNAEIKRLNGVYERILDDAGVTIIDGRASLLDQHTVEINGKRITSERILVATGGWPSVPDIPGKEHVITSNEAFFLDALPKKIVIVGGGYIAVEFAGIFHGLGVDTTLVYRGPLFLRGFDRDLRRHLADEMQGRGIKLLFDTNIDSVKKEDGQFKITYTNETRDSSDLVMYATGRAPNTADLGLEKVGVKLNDKGAIVVNEKYQSSVESIYAIGDVTDRVNLTPVALAEGMVLARTLYNQQSGSVDYNGIPTCIFSQPNLGTVGLTEEEARERYNDIDIYKSSFKPMKMSFMQSDEETFMKLVVEKTTDRVVGVHMLGPDAGEIIQGMSIAMKAEATKSQFDATIGIHPTAAEEFVTMRKPAS
ncbi:MAG TPA: glutathione-disulfide reductase [Gammaproteobacteria bacterium]